MADLEQPQDPNVLAEQALNGVYDFLRVNPQGTWGCRALNDAVLLEQEFDMMRDLTLKAAGELKQGVELTPEYLDHDQKRRAIELRIDDRRAEPQYARFYIQAGKVLGAASSVARNHPEAFQHAFMTRTSINLDSSQPALYFNAMEIAIRNATPIPTSIPAK